MRNYGLNFKKKIYMLFILCALLVGIGGTSVVTYASQLEEAETRDVNVLVISIDPKITNPANGKKEKASEYLGFSLEKSVESLEYQLEQGANGVIDIQIVDTIYLNEFPKYIGFDSMTEKQFLKLFPVGSNQKGKWYDWWTRNNSMKVIPAELDSGMHFDYNYLVQKCDLVEKRNAGCFDMVWVYGIDPLSMYETAMVGNAPFWVNGSAVQADCENFVIAGLTFSRLDGALESLCHLAESMLNYTYQISDAQYDAKLVFEDFSELNTWQKFYLCKHKATEDTEVYGVGQVHFSPNSERDYDWESDEEVLSYHEAFLYQYPNITTKRSTIFTADDYLSDDTYAEGFEGYAAGTRHHIWWLRHMPHFEGRDENGYLHNWWNYILDTKYVIKLVSDANYASNEIVTSVGNNITDIPFEIHYNTGEVWKTTVAESGAVLKWNKKASFLVSDEEIVSVGKGTITIAYDGHTLEYAMEVIPAKTFEINVINGIANGEGRKNEKITIVAEQPKEGYCFKEWNVVSGNIIIEQPMSKETTFYMPEENVIIEAVYEKKLDYKITIVDGTGNKKAESGEKVTIKANRPEKGKKFVGWEVIAGNVEFSSQTNLKTSFIMPKENVIVKAVYDDIK